MNRKVNTMNSKLLFTALAVIAATGCAAQNEPTNGLSPAEAQSAGASVASSIEGSAASYGNPTEGAGFTCHSISPAAPGDADLDHIPDVETTVTFSNCVDGNATINGSFVIEDTALGSPTFNFDASQQATVVINGSNGNATFNVTASLSATEAGGTYGIDENASASVTATSDQGNVAFTETRGWTSTFSPADGNYDVPAEGQPVEDGTLTIDGAYAVTFTGMDQQGHTFQHSGSASVQTVTALQIDDACATHIVSGTIEAHFAGDGQVSAVTVQWTGCDTHQVTVQTSPSS